jgi:hypothetical protein
MRNYAFLAELKDPGYLPGCRGIPGQVASNNQKQT